MLTALRTRILLGLAVIGALFAAGTGRAHADMDDVTVCGFGYGVSHGATTCAFAQSVRSSWLAAPGNDFVAYSPATGQAYEMNCVPGVVVPGGIPVHAMRCTGGADAVVYLW